MRTSVIIVILIAVAAVPAIWFSWRLKGIVLGTYRIRIKRDDRSGVELMPGDTGFALLKERRKKVYFYPEGYSSGENPAGSVKDIRIARHLRANGRCSFKVISSGEDFYIVEYTLG